jgi:phosphoglycerate dehydrogenase-like enzyme
MPEPIATSANGQQGVIVQILGDIDSRRLAVVRAGASRDVIHYGPDSEAAPEVLFVWQQRRQELAAVLASHGNRLRWVHFRRVGIGAPILQLFDAFPGVQLTNGSGASGIAVAEHVLAVLLALYKRLPEAYDNQRRRAWAREFNVSELHQQTACIIGLGDIGRNVARVLRPFGVRLLGVRRQAEAVEEVDETHTSETFLRALDLSNIVILAAPLTPDTRHLIDAAALQRLRRGAYLINVGRGALVNEADLIDALRSGQLAGAALDVFAEEPLPSESPLWTVPNVIVTPHSSAHTQPTDDRSVQLFLANLERFRRGETLLSRMDRDLSY